MAISDYRQSKNAEGQATAGALDLAVDGMAIITQEEDTPT